MAIKPILQLHGPISTLMKRRLAVSGLRDRPASKENSYPTCCDGNPVAGEDRHAKTQPANVS